MRDEAASGATWRDDAARRGLSVREGPLLSRLSRRAFLRSAGRAGLGVGALALVGCGGDAPAPALVEPEPSPVESAPPPTSRIALGARNVEAGPPESGGDLRLPAFLVGLDFFDIHRSRFALTQAFSALQQNKLVRYADIDAGLLEGDLAGLPETPDDETYVFELRPGVVWWNRAPTFGRPVTSDDVLANIARQVAGLDAAGEPEPLFARHALYAQTASLQAVDERILVARTDGPNAPYLSTVHAGPWAFIQAPETWQIFGDDLRDDPFRQGYYSGSGPWQATAFELAGRLELRRHQGYFRAGRPYADAITYLHTADGEAAEAAFRAGQVDVWEPGDATAVDAVLADRPAAQESQRPLPFGLLLAFNADDSQADNPLRDRRLAQAIHLALDRTTLMAAAYGDFGRASGAWPWFLPEWGGDTVPRADRLAARALAAAAPRQALTLALPDAFEATHPGLGALLQTQLREALDIEIALQPLPFLAAPQALRDGVASLLLWWSDSITDPDPTAELLRTVHSQGEGNAGGLRDAEVDTALERMRVTMDIEERRRIFRQELTPRLLEAPTWALVLGHGVQRSLHAPSVHLPQRGFGWDAHRLEDAWLDGGHPSRA